MYMGLKGKHIVITALTNVKDKIMNVYDTNCKVKSYIADITERGEMEQIAGDLLKKYGHIDVLINNAANNPKVEGDATNMKAIQFENFPIRMRMDDMFVRSNGRHEEI